MGHKVMISYAAPDKAIAYAILAALERRKIQCWIAPRNIKPGQNWAIACTQAAQLAKLVVVVFSEAANQSEPVASEARIAQSTKGVETLVFRLEPLPLSDSLNFFLGNGHWMDAFEHSLDVHIDELAERVIEMLSFGRRVVQNAKWLWERSLALTLFGTAAVLLFLLIRQQPWRPPAVPANRPIVPPVQVDNAAKAGGTFSADRTSPQPQVVRSPDSRKETLGSEALPGRAEVEMVFVKGGTFLMGSPDFEPSRRKDESPQHEVSVDSFWMDETEVTYAAYRRFLARNKNWQKALANSAYVDSDYLRDWDKHRPNDKHPVQWVSWYAAHAYCSSEGKRLPTEAEWEYAARAGTTSAYWWGNEWDSARATAASEPTVVRISGHENRLGLFDMLGNLWEWTNTIYKPYPYNASDGREDPNLSGDRVIRGGGYGHHPGVLRSAIREKKFSQTADAVIGFRCAR